MITQTGIKSKMMSEEEQQIKEGTIRNGDELEEESSKN